MKFCNENTKELLESNAAEVYDDISRMYAKKKDFSSAYEYMEKYNQLKDKLYENEHSQVEKQSGMSSVLNEYKRQISHIEFEKQQQLELINQNKKFTILLFNKVPRSNPPESSFPDELVSEERYMRLVLLESVLDGFVNCLLFRKLTKLKNNFAKY